MTKPKGPGKAASIRAGRRASQPALPAWKAFVVQFSRETGIEVGAFSGRIEHLSTGQRAHFASSEELIEFVRAVLEETGSARH